VNGVCSKEETSNGYCSNRCPKAGQQVRVEDCYYRVQGNVDCMESWTPQSMDHSVESEGEDCQGSVGLV